MGKISSGPGVIPAASYAWLLCPRQGARVRLEVGPPPRERAARRRPARSPRENPLFRGRWGRSCSRSPPREWPAIMRTSVRESGFGIRPVPPGARPRRPVRRIEPREGARARRARRGVRARALILEKEPARYDRAALRLHARLAAEANLSLSRLRLRWHYSPRCLASGHGSRLTRWRTYSAPTKTCSPSRNC